MKDGKYEEALERARQGLPIDKIFPELHESEDERIRTRLIALVEAFGQGEYKNEMLAYLERQKELPFVKDVMLGYPGIYFYDGERMHFQGNPAVEEKQKEQKSVPFIPKFRVGDRIISTKNSHLTYNILEVGHINELGNPDYKVEIFTDGESDEPRNIKYIECRKMDEWGVLIEQKPAEWSEEDLQHKSWILECLADGEKKMPEYAEDFQAAYKWLKSLRHKPHWKPSEEQMEILQYLCEHSSHANPDVMPTLESLYHDLQKLL